MPTLNINMEKLERTVQEMYSPAHCGAISLPDAIPSSFCERLLGQLKDAPFERSPPLYGKTPQDFLRFSSETHPIETLPSSFDALPELASAHLELYERIARFSAFQDSPLLSYSVHHYPPRSAGLGSHRDESKYRNLIAVYILFGHRRFRVANTRDLADGTDIPNPPRSLILMRAPRNDSEKNLRPYHSVLGPAAKRVTFLFRHEVTS